MSNEIVVPGSVANLGGGFDTLAVAVQLYLRVRIADVRTDGGARLVVVNSRPPVSGDNAVEQAFAAIARLANAPVPSVFVEVESEIPMAAGLGSSAAASVAGLRVFEQVTGTLPETTLLAVAASIEGHADNAAAALFGGLTSVVESNPPMPLGGSGEASTRLPLRGFGAATTEPYALQWKWPDDVRLIVATPFTSVATSQARAVLAPSVRRSDAVFNLQRVLALVHALQHGEYEQLHEAMRDRWHQPARAALVPHLGAALAIDDPDVLGVCLSGAGPSVAVLARRDFARVERLLRSTCDAAGSPVTVRTLAVHQSSNVIRDAMASAHGRT